MLLSQQGRQKRSQPYCPRLRIIATRARAKAHSSACLPSFAGNYTPQSSTQNLSSGTAGTSSVNLRNLWTNRTLVLINGQRSVPSTITGLVDVNTVPKQLIERVEVVTGGFF